MHAWKPKLGYVAIDTSEDYEYDLKLRESLTLCLCRGFIRAGLPQELEL
jgi:hypothetical protein